MTPEEFLNLLDRISDIEKYIGIGWAIVLLIIILLFLLGWRFITKTIEREADKFYNQSLAKFKGEIYNQIGQDLIKVQGEISAKIAEFNAETNKTLAALNADLDVISQNQIENQNEERKSILEFLNAYSEWLYGTLEVDIVSFKFQNYDDVSTKISEINKAYSHNNIALNKMRFWVKDDELIKLAHDLNKSIMKMGHATILKLTSLRNSLSWRKIYNDVGKNLIQNPQSHKEFIEMIGQEDKRLREEGDALYKEYWAEKNKLFAVVVDCNRAFQARAKEYLNEIQEDEEGGTQSSKLGEFHP